MQVNTITSAHSRIKSARLKNNDTVQRPAEQTFNEDTVSFQGKINKVKLKKAAINGLIGTATGAIVGALLGVAGVLAATVGAVGLIGTLTNDED